MKTKCIVSLVSLAVLAAARVALAAETAEPAPLTLADCLRLADENHPSLAAARAAIEAADRAVDESRSPWWPQVDASAGYHRWQRRAFLPAGLPFPGGGVPELIGPLDDWTAGLTARATIYDFGERRAGVDAATARREGAKADAESVRADLHLTVQRAFFGVAAAEDMRAVAARGLERAQAGLKLAEARRAAGAVPQADVVRMQAEVAAARLDVITVESRVRIATGRLNAAIGRSAGTPVAIAADFSPPAENIDVDAATADALKHRPEIEVARQQEAAAGATLRAARSSRTPHVHADGSVGVNDTDFLPDTREWQIGVSVDVPVFDGGARRSRVARAAAEQKRVEAMLAAVELRVREEVWSAAAELERARAALAANDALVREREESLRIVRARYESGGALVTDLLTTQAALAAAEAGQAGARWDFLMADASFARASGRER